MTAQKKRGHARLNSQSLQELPPEVARPQYDRAAVNAGIVHLGPGAFHRAHQAVYTDDALNLEGGDWGIIAVSLRSPGLRDALEPQDNLYTLAVLGEAINLRVIGAIRETLVAPEDPEAVCGRLCRPDTRIVTLTVTEKGYCLTPNGDLDTAHADIRHDLSGPRTPVSATGYLVEGLRRRREAGLAPFAVISCDNLSGNGERLRRSVLQYAGELDRELAEWIGGEVCFPSTMVDSITPATDDSLCELVGGRLGVFDAWPVQREPFAQWVIEDRITGPLPAWRQAGVTFSGDVEGFEKVKLRMLNGTHSALAYLGLLLGLETVAETMTDATLRAFAERLIEREITPALVPPAGLDIREYGRSVIARFANPAIRHLLSQIAWDGSHKLPIRLLGSIQANLAAGRPVDLLCMAIAAWLHHIRRSEREGASLVDPYREVLYAVARSCSGDAEADICRFLALDAVFPPGLAADRHFVDTLTGMYEGLQKDVRAAMTRALAG